MQVQPNSIRQVLNITVLPNLLSAQGRMPCTGGGALKAERRVTTVFWVASLNVGPYFCLPCALLMSLRDLNVFPQVLWPFRVDT